MRFAIVSDIHGNLPALNAVIEDAGKNSIDTFIFVGDYCLSNKESHFKCAGAIITMANS